MNTSDFDPDLHAFVTVPYTLSDMILTETTLGEICESGEGEIQTGPFGSQLHKSDYQEEGTPVVMPSDIVEGNISTDDVARVSEEMVTKLSSHRLSKGDIIFGRRGDIGRCALVTRRSEGWLCGTGCIRVTPGNQGVISKFLFYYLSRSSTAKWLENHAVGATMANLNTSILESVPVQLPPLPVQRRIAEVLTAYDDLIENNRRRIELLEEMAQAVYREWFVAMRFPGHEDAEMRETEALGPVPEGWAVVKLKDVANINRANVQKDDAPETIRYITISCVNEGDISDIEKMPYIESPSRAKRIAQHGDILWSKVRPNLKGYGLVLNPAPNTIASTGFAVISPGVAPYSYLYPALTTEDFVSFLVNRTSGAAYPAVKVRDFKNAEILLPLEDVLKAYDTKVRPLYELKERLAARNDTLRRTRDLLLPRLMSGEVEVDLMNETVEGDEPLYVT